MCGIAGFIDFKGNSSKTVLQKMVETLKHRGPDDFGAEVYENDDIRIGFGQSRLSIIDLSQGGHQPMHFKHLSCVFNGEIYNYKEVKDELIKLGHEFLSGSDTEVILHSVAEWGLDAVEKFIGMFVYVIYDRDKQQISVTRDRAGVKPFYYYQSKHLFLFGSELKALMAHPGFKKDIDKSVLPAYLHYGYIPAPYSIFENTRKLNPGHHLILDLKSCDISLHKYWDATEFYRQPKTRLSYEEAKSQLHELLKSACNYRMVADVPVGVFLSGGYDSTAVASILQANSKEKLKTFTIGFKDGNNEAPFAKETAAHLGTEHTEYYCTEKEAQGIISDLPYFYDEPFGDSSAIPTMLVSRMAKEKVTVALSADAGDELFFGYKAHFNQYENISRLNRIPTFLKKPIGKIGQSLNSKITYTSIQTRHKLDSFFYSLDINPFEQAKKLYHRAFSKPNEYIKSFLSYQNHEQESPFEAIDISSFKETADVFLATDYQNYLQNDILTKVDRATMSVSLEGREPLLDHRLLEFSAQLPLNFKYSGSKNGKRILKDIVHEYVPAELMQRPKAGFSVPVLKWLRGDLSYLLNTYLSVEALEQSQVFDVTFVRKELDSFRNSQMHYSPLIWYVLMFQMWYAKWVLNKI